MPGRHRVRTRPSRRWLALVAAAVVAVLAIAWGVQLVGSGGEGGSDRSPVAAGAGATDGTARATKGPARATDRPSGAPSASAHCASRTVVQVVTTADLLPTLAALAAGLAARPAATSACADYRVSARSSVEVADAIAADPTSGPDVWIPDSSLWLERAQAEARAALRSGGSVATSPLVIAVPKSLAGKLPAATPLAWKTLLSGAVPARLSDPNTTTAGLTALVSAQSALGSDPATKRALDAAMITLSRTAAPGVDQLFAAVGTRAAVAFPASEQQVFAETSKASTPSDAQARSGPAAVLPADGTGTFDYPFVQLPSRSDAVNAAGLALWQVLSSADGRHQLEAAGFRTSPDSVGPTPGAGPSPKVLAAPSAAEVARVLHDWDAVRTDMRMLAVIDVSGSMNTKEGARTRIQLAAGSAKTALKILPPKSEVGLWEFSTFRGGPKQDWKQIVPIAQLDARQGSATQRDRLLKAADTLPGEVRGNTGLYDTVLAAYQHMQKTYDSQRVNSIVLLTDGQDHDPTGITLPQLDKAMKAVIDPQKPTLIITVGMGPDADAKALSRIAALTGGQSFIAKEPKDIQRVFVSALLQRQCRPNCG